MSLVPWWCLLYVIGCHGYVHKPASSWNVYQFHTYPHPAKKQVIPRDIMVNVINNLGLKLLAIHNEYNENNIAISPYGALSVLIALGEGLEGDAVYEIQRAAQIPNDISVIRVGLRDIHRHLKSYFIPKEGFLAGLSLNHDNVTLRPEYEEILKFYGYDVVSFNSALYPEPETTEKPEISTKGEIITTEEHTTVESSATEKEARFESTTEQLTTENEKILTTNMIESTTKAIEETSLNPITRLTTTILPESTVTVEQLTTENEKILTTNMIESTTKAIEETSLNPTTRLTTTILPESTVTMVSQVEETTTAIPLSTNEATTTAVPLPITEATTTDIIAGSTEGTTTEKVTSLDISSISSATTEVNSPDEIVTEPIRTTRNQETTTTIFTSQMVTITETSIPFTSTESTTLQTDTTEVTSTNNPITSPFTTTDLPTTLVTTTSPISESTTENTTPLPIATTLVLNGDTQEVTSTLPSVTSDLSNEDSTSTYETITTPITTTSFSTTLENGTSTTITSILNEDSGDNEIDAPPTISEGFGGTFKRQTLSKDINAVQLNIMEKRQSNDEQLKRNSRSIVDYLIARYYDDQYDHGHYVPIEQPSFLVYGKYKEYNINFMKYDTVLPFHYVSHLKSLALSFPLDSTKYYLLLLLPENENGIDKLICDLRLNGSLKYIIENMRYTHVIATIPSFMLKGYVTLTPSFQKLGIRRVFEPRQADFSLMTSQRGIYVTNIEQAITVTIRNYVDPNSLGNYSWRSLGVGEIVD